MADARVADDMAKSARFGIADMLMARFDRQIPDPGDAP
jgi:Rod binding domain-containing protein